MHGMKYILHKDLQHLFKKPLRSTVPQWQLAM